MSYLKYDGTAATETAAPITNFYGTSGAETLTGNGGPDSLWGNGGDTLVGGAGDDTFYLQSAGNLIIDNGGGVDKLVGWSNVSIQNQPHIANLEVDGNNVYGAGNAGDNIIYAGSGTVQLYGGGGQDVFVAGSGQDTFIIQKGTGNDAIYGFKPATDVIRLSAGYTDFSQVQAHMTQVGADVKIDMGGSDGLVIRNTQVSQLTAANFQLQLDPSKLGGMTFHDEFNGSSLSIWNATYNPTGAWRPDYGYQGSQGVGSYTLTGNNEAQIYTSPYYRDAPGTYASPFSEGGGNLTITAQNAPAGASDLFGYQYTSGMISTKESFAQTYGYFEMRAELPSGAGGWPAFWLVPADGSWPPELDVMETLSNDVHADWTTQHTGASNVATGATSYIPDTTDGFHTYGVLWTKTDLVWYVDGVQVFHTATPADMNKPMYMIANLALGGWGGAIDNSAIPEQMKIDYIRSYALADGSTATQGFDAGNGGGAAFSTTTSPPAAGSGASTPVSPPPTTVSPPPPVSPPPATGSSHSFTSTGGDVLVGTSGADTFTAGAAPTTMTGGGGDDHFVFTAEPWAPTHITDFAVGHDVLDISALLTQAGYHGTDPVADHYVTLQSDGNGGTELLFNPAPGSAAHPWPDYIINLDHTSATTWADLQGAATTTSPPPVSPPPVSPPPVSPPPASSGGTTTTPGAGETLTGHAGGDTLQGGAGDDLLTGSSGNNLLYGGDGNDVINGGSGFNVINGNRGDDTIVGNSQTGDWLLGGQGNDMITANSGSNLIYGNLGNDTLHGGSGFDIIRGGQGDDSIVAGSGPQWISGDRGNDTIQGGTGADTFHSSSGAGMDVVYGFDASKGDHVQLDPGTHFTLSQSGADTLIDLGNGDEMILKNVTLSTLPTGWLFGS